jgi:uncharacterized membrane protein
MKIVRVALGIGYPFLLYGALQMLEPRIVALGAGVLLLLRLLVHRRRSAVGDLRRLLVPALLVAGVILLTWISNDARFALFVPGLVSGAVLVAFGRTLFRGPTLIETFARMQHPDLSPERVAHCRSFTGIWTAFLLVNTGVCLGLAVSGDLEVWAIYTGFASYVLMGLLFAAEFAVRSWRFGLDDGLAVSATLRRIFPGSGAS